MGVRGVDKIYDVTVISRKTDDICWCLQTMKEACYFTHFSS